MELRAELMPPQLDEAKVQQLANLAGQVIAALEHGQDAEPAIAAFNAVAKSDCSLEDFAAVWESTSTLTFVQGLLTPQPQRLEDITEDELLELIKRVSSGEYSEHLTDYWLSLLDRNVPHPDISDLIFWNNLKPEEVLRRALEYKPIQL